MSRLSEPAFSFRSGACDALTFDVMRFTGREALSEIYAFDIWLLSEKGDVDPTAVLQSDASFTIHPPFAPEGGLVYNGILSSFALLHRIKDRFVYRARLQHRLWWLTLTRHNRIFLDKTPEDVISEVLREGSLNSGTDFVWKCQQNPGPRSYVCQYAESDFAFISRWMERLGVYYWFDHRADGVTCVMADARGAHSAMPDGETCRFAEPSGLNPESPGLVITDFSLEQFPLPQKVQCKTYNPEKPSLDLTCTADVQAGGRGTLYSFGDNYADKNEGDALAGVLAEALLCRESVFSGMSHNPALRPGFLFSLERHFRSGWNQRYLTTETVHEGSQARHLLRAFNLGSLEDGDRLYYRNHFRCIPEKTQFRAPRVTPWPQVAGNVVGHVDAEGSGATAMLDAQGRYKITLPFDLSGRSGGKASSWLRMMQPYAGENMGFHAPLHKGTEVMIAFIDGDPDRPIINGAVPNPQTPSPVNDATATQIRLTSASGQKVHLEDAAGKEHILLSAPDSGSYIRIGRKG